MINYIYIYIYDQFISIYIYIYIYIYINHCSSLGYICPRELLDLENLERRYKIVTWCYFTFFEPDRLFSLFSIILVKD